MPLSMTRGDRASPRRDKAEQRERVLASAERLLSQASPDGLDVSELCADAQVTQEAFDALFDGREDLCVALFDRLVSRLGGAMTEAYRGERVWVDAIRAALLELLTLLDRRPHLARFMLVFSLQGSTTMLARREQALRMLARSIESNCPDVATEPTPPFGAEAVVGAVASVLHGRLLEDPVPSLRELAGSLMGVLVMPYLDVSAARQELSRPLPPLASRRVGQSVLHLGRSTPPGMRVTARTAQVLEAIDARPGLSNIAIASTVGIADQGQISRLLARLRGLNLIEDLSSSVGSQTRKAWRVTPAGASLLADLQPGAGSSCSGR
jgi:AcrR family transcriptional regulator